MAEAVVITEVEDKVIVDSGIELIIIIEEDHMGIKTPEKVAGETTQEVLSTRTILRISWIKINMLSIITISICKLYIVITRKYSPSSWIIRIIGKIKEIKENILE
jgi:hypothetical protein